MEPLCLLALVFVLSSVFKASSGPRSESTTLPDVFLHFVQFRFLLLTYLPIKITIIPSQFSLQACFRVLVILVLVRDH